ncbi:hypothetical protein HanRHA438_Chr16g0742411 [Helianthus annuus]|nr:hypothetical protein HanRHA438_Chr16g0742411 [Helianthus annuus]
MLDPSTASPKAKTRRKLNMGLCPAHHGAWSALANIMCSGNAPTFGCFVPCGSPVSNGALWGVF